MEVSAEIISLSKTLRNTPACNCWTQFLHQTTLHPEVLLIWTVTHNACLSRLVTANVAQSRLEDGQVMLTCLLLHPAGSAIFQFVKGERGRW